MGKFKIGQRVVCIVNHEAVKKGTEYIVMGIRKSDCGCVFRVDVGIKPKSKSDFCSTCSCSSKNKDGIWWIAEHRFAPIIEQSDFKEMTFTEVRETVQALVKMGDN